MPPQIPIDILPEILRHFVGELDEQTVLHNLLFVNRLWCRTVMPLLWANPFLLCQQPENRVKLINTFIACFSDHDKAVLVGRNVQVPNTILQPTMDYATYITHLEEKNVIESVNAWYENTHPTEENKYEATVISAMLIKMFVERATHIKWFHLDCDAVNAKNHNGTISHQDYMADKILESVANHQHSLQRISVVFNSQGSPIDCTPLLKLVTECVKHQGKFLRDFVIENANGEGFAEVHHALRPRANSLKRVGYTSCDFAHFPWGVGIEILSQVEELYFIACTNLREEKLQLLLADGVMEKPFPEFHYYVIKGLDS